MGLIDITLRWDMGCGHHAQHCVTIEDVVDSDVPAAVARVAEAIKGSLETYQHRCEYNAPPRIAAEAQTISGAGGCDDCGLLQG